MGGVGGRMGGTAGLRQRQRRSPSRSRPARLKPKEMMQPALSTPTLYAIVSLVPHLLVAALPAVGRPPELLEHLPPARPPPPPPPTLDDPQQGSAAAAAAASRLPAGSRGGALNFGAISIYNS